MVRINLINPRKLADQHLIAEYNEILMLLGYVRLHPEPIGIPAAYRLGKGHIKFFKDKLKYLKDRHELIKVEMKRRGFRPKKSIRLSGFPRSLHNNWQPTKADKDIIMQRLKSRIRKKPGYYRYQGEQKPVSFFIRLLQ